MNANEYQDKVIDLLKKIFPANLVKKEWDAATTFGDSRVQRMVYAPRIDIAIGPFGNRFTLDIGDDQTASMQSHDFTKKLFERHYNDVDTMEEVWNKFARCYLAIEVEFSGSSKHILGDIINVATNGALAFLVVDEKNYDKAMRIMRYVLRQENVGVFEVNTLKNLIIFNDGEFLSFLNGFIK